MAWGKIGVIKVKWNEVKGFVVTHTHTQTVNIKLCRLHLNRHYGHHTPKGAGVH